MPVSRGGGGKGAAGGGWGEGPQGTGTRPSLPPPTPHFPRHCGLRLHHPPPWTFSQEVLLPPQSFSFLPQASHPASSSNTDPPLSSLVSPRPEATRRWKLSVGAGGKPRLAWQREPNVVLYWVSPPSPSPSPPLWPGRRLDHHFCLKWSLQSHRPHTEGQWPRESPRPRGRLAVRVRPESTPALEGPQDHRGPLP